MPTSDGVLGANEAFYRAFSRADLSAMDELWARGAPVSCIHPGGPILVGRAAVLRSWAAILGGARSVGIECRNARVRAYGDTAIVLCYELLAGQTLAATNVFVREDGAWRISHHQAGSAATLRRRPATARPRTVH